MPNIFIGELETDFSEKFENFSIDEQVIKKKSTLLFVNIQKKRIGYNVFKYNNEIYKLFILPKTINYQNKKDNEIIEEFFNFILRLYRLSNQTIFKDNSVKTFSKLSLKNNGIDEIKSFEDLINVKYFLILQRIYDFFKKHKSSKRVSKQYISQTIKHKLDLKANISELNKSKIHQSKKEFIVYSQIAEETLAVLKLFRKIKLPHIKNNSKKIEQVINHINSLIKKKFQLSRSNLCTIEKLISHKTKKLFSNKQDQKNLYSDILSLFCIENFIGNNLRATYINEGEIDSLFFYMPDYYEYDIFTKLSYQLKDNTNIKIEFDKNDKILENENIENTHKNFDIKYSLKINSSNTKDKTSKPDLIYTDIENKNKYIIDAKWKVLKNRAPDLADILKLKRDCEIRNTDDYNIFALLIYPNVTNDFCAKEYLYSDTDNNSEPTFTYYIMEVPFIEEKTSFNLGFVKEKAFNHKYINPILLKTDELFSNNNELVHNLKYTIKNHDNLIDNESVVITDILEQNLIKNNTEIAEQIQKQYGIDDILRESNNFKITKMIKNIYDKNISSMEDEVKNFFLTSITSIVYYYIHHKKYDDTFDHTIFIATIWKSIEIELNASIIYLLRYINNCCEKNSYNIKNHSTYKELKIIKENFKGKHYSDKLVIMKTIMNNKKKFKNVEFGIFPTIFKNFYAYEESDIYKNFSNVIPDIDDQSNIDIYNFLSEKTQDIVNIRNKHTHQDIMDYPTFESSIKKIFGNDESSSIIYIDELFKLKNLINNYSLKES